MRKNIIKALLISNVVYILFKQGIFGLKRAVDLNFITEMILFFLVPMIAVISLIIFLSIKKLNDNSIFYELCIMIILFILLAIQYFIPASSIIV